MIVDDCNIRFQSGTRNKHSYSKEINGGITKKSWSKTKLKRTAKFQNLAAPYPASGTHVGIIWILNVLGRSLQKFCQL